MSWYYQREIAVPPADAQAFVYLITNVNTGRKYIGKKNLTAKKTTYKQHTQKNGKKVRKRVVKYVDSDWQDYWGSCKPLLDDIFNQGKYMFKREILLWCHSRQLAAYHEARLQFEHNVLLDSNYYNGIIQCRINQSHLK